MGIGGEMGQFYFQADDGAGVWYLWMWAFGPEEDEVPTFDAFIGQYNKKMDKYFAYEDTISLNKTKMVKQLSAGATQLAVAASASLISLLFF